MNLLAKKTERAVGVPGLGIKFQQSPSFYLVLKYFFTVLPFIRIFCYKYKKTDL